MFNLFERELLRRLPSYREAELIDDESARKLGAHLTAQIESPNRLFVQAVYAVGSALIIAAGVIAVIHNWNSIGHEMRLLLAFMPLLFAAIFGGFVLKIDAAQTWKEVSALLNITAVAVMIAVIGQEYKIIAPTQSYWLAVTLLSLPAAFIFNSGLAAGTLAIMAVSTIKYGFHDTFYSFMVFTAICATLFAALYIRVPKLAVFKCLGMIALLSVFIPAACALIPDFGAEEYNFIISAVLVCGFCSLAIFAAFEKRFKGVLRIAAGLAAIILFATVAVFFNEQATCKNLLHSEFEKLVPTQYIFVFYAAIALMAALYLSGAIFAAKDKNYHVIALSLAFPLALVSMFFIETPLYVKIAINVLMFVSGLMFIAAGFRRGMLLYANIGLLILIYQTLLRIFLNETSVTAKIAICGIAGTLLILMNFIFFRKVKA